jgi:hypothetical protein
MRHIPSKDMLHKRLSDVMRDNIPGINQIRHLLVDWRNGDIKSREMMAEADGLLQGHGVEHLRSRNGKAEAYYVNMGDPYSTTIILDTGKDRVWITGWGDWVEAEERNGNKFD